MKETKRRFELFAFYDHTAIQEHLEKMAAKGWLLEKPGNYLWTYRRIEPQTLHFAVTYFPTASDFDPGPTEGQQVMEEYAAKDGWQIVARWGQMQIFSNAAKHPTPIETDAVTQVETVHRAMRKGMIPTHLFLLVLCVYQLVFNARLMFRDPVDFLSKPYLVNALPAWIMLIVAVFFELGFYFWWYRRAKAAAADGTFLALRTNHAISWALIVLSVFLVVSTYISSSTGRWGTILYAAVLILSTFAVNRAKAWMKKNGFSRGVNRTLSILLSVVLVVVLLTGMVFVVVRYGLADDRTPVGTYEFRGETFEIYNDPMPLSVEALMDVGDGQWTRTCDFSETFLLSHAEYRQRTLLTDLSGLPDLQYTIVDIKVPFLYDLVKQSVLDEHQDEPVPDSDYVFRDSYVPVDASIWDAKEVYQLHWSESVLDTYLVCWEDRIVEIQFFWTPTPEQIALAAEKLR